MKKDEKRACLAPRTLRFPFPGLAHLPANRQQLPLRCLGELGHIGSDRCELTGAFWRRL